MNDIVNFLKSRRSVSIRNLESRSIPPDDLEQIIECGVRVPDHGILSPWRIKIIQGDARKRIGEEILEPEFKMVNPEASDKVLKIERERFLRAGAVIAVISKISTHPRIPDWEMQLSCGAVCQNILTASLALGYGAQWVTEWYSENEKLLEHLGGDVSNDRFAGFIYVGSTSTTPIERRRAPVEEIIDYVQ